MASVGPDVVMNASFNGMGKPMPAMHISVGRMMVIYVPLAIVSEKMFGIAGVFASYAIANIVSGVVAFIWARASVQEQCDLHGVPIIASETI